MGHPLNIDGHSTKVEAPTWLPAKGVARVSSLGKPLDLSIASSGYEGRTATRVHRRWRSAQGRL